MSRFFPFVILIIFSCSSESVTSNIRIDENLSELEHEETISTLNESSIVKGIFYTEDTTSLWYSRDSTRLNLCYCSMEDDSLEIIVGYSTIFNGVYTTLKISEGRYTSRILRSFCTDESYTLTQTSQLTLNSLNYKIGSTLIGEFTSLESRVGSTENMNFEGKFQCVIIDGS